MFDNNYCRLCEATADLIAVFSEYGIGLRISDIIGHHFWFKIHPDDLLSKSICTKCWSSVEKFNVFYLNTKMIQEKRILPCLESHKSESAGAGFINQSNQKQDDEHSFDEVEYLQCELDNDKDAESVRSVESSSSTKFNLSQNQSVGEETKTSVEKFQTNATDDNTKAITPRRNARIGKRTSAQSLQQDELIRSWCDMQCTECPVMFHRFPEVKIHYRDVHQRNGYIVCCQKKFFRRVRALEHIGLHYDPNKFRCEPCNKSFADKPGLMNHMDGHVPAEQRRFQCSHCPRNYVKKFQLDQHARLRHISDDEKKYVCSECGKTFANNSILQTHIRGVHNNTNSHICEICAKTFKSKLIFERHGLLHSNIEQPRVQCQVCKQWLKNEGSLRSHLSRHTDTQHKCDLCGKISPNRNALRSHQRYVHFVDASHQCNVCGKTFKKPIALREHMALHTGEILYTCSLCPKTFNSSANMHAHKKKKHFAEWQRDRLKRGKKCSD